MSQEAGEPSHHRNHVQPLFQFISVTPASFNKRGKLPRDPRAKRHIMLEKRRRDRMLAVEQCQRAREQALSAEKAQSAGAEKETNTEGEILRNDPIGEQEVWADSVVGEQLELAKQHPAAWMLDPFESFAAPIDKYNHAALEYYANVVVPSTRPFDLPKQNGRTSKMIGLILSDTAAIDSFTAAMTIGRATEVYNSRARNQQLRMHDGDEDNSASSPYLLATSVSDAPRGSAQALMRIGLAYMTRSMQKLNQQTSKSGLASGDAVIATVRDILVSEILMGGVSTGETHAQGLAAIVRSRGGPEFIPAYLMDSVFLSDMHMATMVHRPSSYLLLDVHKSSLRTFLPSACSEYGLTHYRRESLVINDRLLATLDGQFCRVLEHLQDVVNYINSFGASQAMLRPEFRKLYLSKTFAVEHGILSHIKSHHEGPSHEIESFYISATLLFIYTSIQKWKSHSPLVRKVVRQLQDFLSKMNQNALLALDSNLFLWSLFIGAYASLGQATRQCFVLKIRRVTADLLIREWVDVRACLMACYYIDNLFREPFEEIWREAAIP